jgi:potassium efflux system protein
MRALSLLLFFLIFHPIVQARAAELTLPSPEQVEDKLNSAAANGDTGLVKIYRDILAELEQIERAQKQQDEFQETINSFTQLSNQVAKAAAALEKQPIIPPPKSDSELERLLAQSDADLVQVRGELVNLDQDIAEINQRVPQVPDVVENLKNLQQQLKVDSVGVSASATSLHSEAQKWLEQTKNARIDAELKALSLEQLSSNNRLELSRLKRDKEKLKLAKLTEQSNIWRLALSERLRAGTAQLVEAAKLGAEEQNSLPLLTQQAKENEEWAKHLSNLTELIEQTAEKRAQTTNIASELAQDKALLSEQLGLSEVGEALGERLLNQYDLLGRIKPDSTLDDRIAKARLWRFRYREQAELLQDRGALIRNILAENNTLLEPTQREQLNKILDTRAQLVNQLNSLQEKYILELAKYQGVEKQRLSNAAALRELISQHLLWVANTRAIDMSWPAEVLNSAKRLLNKDILIDIKQATEKNPVRLGVLLAACLLTLLLHNSKRRHLHNEISELAKPVGRVTQDDISYTLKALGLSFLAAVIYLLPLLALVWLFYVPSWEHPHAAAAGAASITVSQNLLVILFIHQLCRPQGVLCCHFARDPKITTEASRALTTFGSFFIPVSAVVLFCNHFSDPLISAGFGRFLFMICCVLLTIMLLRITSTYQRHSRFEANQLRWFKLFSWTVVMVPLVALAAAFSGYYYSGRVLLSLVSDSLILAGLFWLIYIFAYRYMAIQERRLAYERAKARRAELIAQREKEREKEKNAEDRGSERAIEVEEYEVNVDLLKAQALRLIRISLLVGFAFALMAIWKEVLSALTWLDDIVVWQTQRGDLDIDITLKNMLASAVTLGMTFVIARNLPSLIELAILQRLTLEPGVGFAISTLTRYGATLVGALWGFSIIGFEWSKLQWLVAALGVGLGFGLQEIFANMVSGLIILFERPIRPGDTVTIDNLSGTVSKIHIRATTIVDWDRKEIVIPNKTFITQQFVNWSLSDGITRIVIKVGVAYGSDVDLVEKLLREAIRDCYHVLDTPEPSVFFLGFGNSTLDFEVRVFTAELGQRLPVTHRMHQLINAKFNDHGVTIAFPQLDVHMFRGK